MEDLYYNEDPPLYQNFYEGEYGYGGDFGDEDASMFGRFLKATPYPVDYSVVSVGIMTLGMLLVVELIRHQLDHIAHHRPFFNTVLEGVYSELATLGIVELFIYLLHKYYKNLSNPRYKVFSDVHFALFYTAIFNAFQSVVLAICTMRVSTRRWVKTENLDLDHYVEIREEFERVQDRLRSVVGDANFENGFGVSGVNQSSADQHPSGGFFGWIRSRLLIRVFYPQLKTKYINLLIQVKFHQLRLHFVEEHKLPLHFKVSDYLKRSERSVLQHMVHVSPMAWLMLTFGANLVYFAMGMVAFVTEDPVSVGLSLAGIFFLAMAVFVWISVALHYKMKSIFQRILNMRSSDLYNRSNDGKEQQLSFFWGRDPHLVIGLIQFMHFGYALALSIVIIYWKDLKGDINRWYYVIAVFACYIIFVCIMSYMLPEYTLCTSLAHLYNKKHLQETLASYRLEAARKKQKRIMAERDMMITNQKASDSMVLVPYVGDEAASTGGMSNSNNTSNSNPSNIPDTSQSVRSMSTSNSYESLTNLANSSDAPLDNSAVLAALVKSDTKSLRFVMPQESKRVLVSREQRKNQRRANRRAMSDGVAFMRAAGDMVSGSNAASVPVPTEDATRKSVSSAGDLALANSSSRIRKSASADDLANVWGGAPQAENNDHAASTADSARIVDQVPSLQSAGVLQLVEEEEDSVDALSDVDLGEGAGDMVDLASAANSSGYHEPVPLSKKLQNWLSWNFLTGQLRDFFLHKKYPLVSHVFGTIVVFFLISQRVESILTLTYVIDESSNTWNMRIFVGFWWIAGLFVVFLFEDFAIMLFFAGSTSKKGENDSTVSENRVTQRRLILAAAIDIVISGACLALLFLAEMQRCCDSDEKDEGYGYELYEAETGPYRDLAKTDEKDGYGDSGGGSGGFIDKHFESTNYDCCPRWGERTYGGLGMIEPFTGIIVLRVLRFTLARYILGEPSKHSKAKSAKEETTSRTEPHDVSGDNSTESGTAAHSNHHHNHDHGHESMANESGTALELWEHAIGKYPEIVDKYGEFSAELFQAMLGLPIVENLNVKKQSSLDASNVAQASIPLLKANGESSEDQTIVAKDSQGVDDSQHISLTGKHYSNLPAEAQKIIIAGKLGKPVKSTPTIGMVSFTNLPTLNEVHEHDDDDHRPSDESPSKAQEISIAQDRFDPIANLPCTPAEFVVDKEQMARESNNNYDMFVAPNAQLVRAMRRCDRRLLPLLNEWAVVDLVMTKYELVYFEASDSEDDAATTALILALKATKGGKGLRLCDVAAGRKVVGHMELSEVTELHVERDTALVDTRSLDMRTQKQSKRHLFDENSEDVLFAEYWIRPTENSKPTCSTPASQSMRNNRWTKVNEDRLKLVSPHGTLIMRFYSDLESAEAEANGITGFADCEHIIKDIAFQWAQTIARMCGRNQLKQNLPHFGENNEEELRDYLEVKHFHEKEEEEHLKLNRRSSTVGSYPLSERMVEELRQEVDDSAPMRPASVSSFSRGESFP